MADQSSFRALLITALASFKSVWEDLADLSLFAVVKARDTYRKSRILWEQRRKQMEIITKMLPVALINRQIPEFMGERGLGVTPQQQGAGTLNLPGAVPGTQLASPNLMNSSTQIWAGNTKMEPPTGHPDVPHGQGAAVPGVAVPGAVAVAANPSKAIRGRRTGQGRSREKRK